MSRPRLVLWLLILVTLALYWPVMHFDFIVYDDGGYVYENRIVENGLTWGGLRWAFTHQLVGNWHPVTVLSHMLDCQLFGVNPGMAHLVNVLLHAANAALLLMLLFRLSGSLWPSAMVAALFAWHPLHVESVAWISERKDVLSTFFELAALLAYARYAQDAATRSDISPTAGYKSRSYWLALFFFALALMSKPMVVTFPFLLLLLDCWPLQRFSIADIQAKQLGRLALEKWPFFLLTAVASAATFLAQRNGEAVVTLAAYPLTARLENMAVSYGQYLIKTFWPVNLSIVYPLPDPSGQLLAKALIALTAMVAATWLFWRARRSQPFLIIGWLWFLGTLVPVIGLVQVGRQAFADRYMYLPAVGVFIIVVFGVHELFARVKRAAAIPAVIAALALAGCLVATAHELQYWRSSELLFSRAVAITKKNDIALSNLGLAYQQQGRRAEALVEYRKALALNPDRSDTHNNMGTLLMDLGNPEEALMQFRDTLHLNPRDVSANLNLGMALVKLRRFDEAIGQYNAASRIDPADPQFPFQTGRALLLAGRDEEVVPYFREALRLGGNDFQMLIFVARVLASDRNPSVRNGAIALTLAAKANDLTQSTQPVAFDSLAMAFAEIGQFDQARSAEESAVKLAVHFGQNEDVSGMKARLELYQNRQPYRQTFAQSTNAAPLLPAPKR